MILVLCGVTEFSVIVNYQGFGITSCFQLLTACSMFLQTFGNYHNVTQPHRAKIFITNTLPHATMISLSFTMECLIICALSVLTFVMHICTMTQALTERSMSSTKLNLSSAALKLRCSILLAPQYIYIFFNIIILISYHIIYFPSVDPYRIT